VILSWPEAAGRQALYLDVDFIIQSDQVALHISASDRERTAGAIFATDYVHPKDARWEQAQDNVRRHYDNQARAVIRALFCANITLIFD